MTSVNIRIPFAPSPRWLVQAKSDALLGIERSISEVNQVMLHPLQSYLADFSDQMATTYTHSLTLMAELRLFFSREPVKKSLTRQAQRMFLWRKPRIDISAGKFLVYQYVHGYFWHSWSRSQGIDNFLETNGKDIVNDIISSMVTDLSATLRDQEIHMKHLQTEVKNSIITLQRTFTDFVHQTEVNADFIQTNFLGLDIYYTELKYLEVEQQVAYGLAEFWSEFGGLLGLLLGGSILTVIEFMDFILVSWARRVKLKREQQFKQAISQVMLMSAGVANVKKAKGKVETDQKKSPHETSISHGGERL